MVNVYNKMLWYDLNQTTSITYSELKFSVVSSENIICLNETFHASCHLYKVEIGEVL